MTTKEYKSIVVVTENGSQVRVSKRGVQLLELLEKGLSNKEIANQIGITEHTVKVHLWRLYLLAGVNSRTQAVKWWSEHYKPPSPMMALLAFFHGVCKAMDDGVIQNAEIQVLRQRVDAVQKGLS